MLAVVLRFLKVFALGVAFGVVGTIGVVAVLVTTGALLFATTREERRVLPDGPTLVEAVREVARLETLDVRTHKKVTLEVDPPRSESVIGGVLSWARWTVDPPVGSAFVFADVHIGLDLTKIDETTLRVQDDVVRMVLPPLETRVELRPGETEIVHSNLDSAQTAQLLDEAKWKIHRDVAGDPILAAKARESAKRALRDFLLAAGFREVVFVDEMDAAAAPPDASS